jgi:RNA polymerase sigma factor (TIGR02999 family)
VAEINELLLAASNGDRAAADHLFATMYQELKQIARSNLRRSGGAAELDTTAVVHESFLKLVGAGTSTPVQRRAFYAYIGKVMRSVVLDAVRENRARKRGGDLVPITLTTGIPDASLDETQLLAIDEALTTLDNLAPELKELVEMRYFAGLTVPQISELTGRSVRSIERDWEKARLILRQLMSEA